MDRFEVLNNIEIYTDKFTETGSFSHAMQVFCWARANGLPIPEVILDAIEKGFVEWGKHDGRKGKGLDDIFGLKAGKGNSSVLSPGRKIARNKKLFTIMAKLMLLGWSEKNASEAASRWLDEQYTANPGKYRWLNHANSGRKGKDDHPEEKNLLTPESILRERKKNKQLFAEAERDAAQSLIFWDDQKKQAVEKFYLNLINVSIEKENPKTAQELLEILVS
ncbi:hypothetical protein [Nitrosomonas sp.]|uniref:hypothetical protein n=1 Tax=Nitrosomonas sp. TaxID=42353 RepID=UPI001DE66F6A|nr:hypothetical protein [Nitrosomonas sp.]MBX3616982.1 hypothetical protein [Nitrosomonas sp.]